MAANVTHKARYVCAWCRTADTTTSPHRTPFPGVQPLGSVGLIVCSPECPDRPTGPDGKPVRVYTRTSNVNPNVPNHRVTVHC